MSLKTDGQLITRIHKHIIDEGNASVDVYVIYENDHVLN